MLQDVQADAAICVDVRVEHLGQELDFRSFIWVILCKLNGEVETSSFPDSVLRPEDHSLPEVKRVATWSGLNAFLGCIFVHLFEVFEKTSLGIGTHFSKYL